MNQPLLRTMCCAWVRACVLLVALVLLVPFPARAQQQERPNVVFIFSDDHAAHALGAYGGRLAALDPTPHLDRLARQGMLFRNAFVTNSICAPSRAVILTGKHSHLNGVTTNRREDSLDTSQQTFPKLLQQAGYQTALVGKWHLKSDPAGFDYWEILYPGQGFYYNPDFRTPEDTTRYTGYVTNVITDRAIHWLEEGRNPEEPFLLMVQHKAPHRPWLPGPEHLLTYEDVKIPAPKSLFYDYSGLSSAAVMQQMEIATDLGWGADFKLPVNPHSPSDSTGWYRWFFQRRAPEQHAAWEAAYGARNERFYERYRTGRLQGRDLTRWKYQQFMEDYLRTVASMDDNIGRLLDYLEENGLAENTIVVYSSDQGFFLGENGWFDKRWMYEESLRIPLIVRWPGVVEPGSENTDLVLNLDFAETFLDIAGAQIPEAMQGHSLVPLLEGETPENWRAAMYYHYYEGGGHGVPRHDGVRTERYKLIHFYTLDQWELFDLEKDPDELRSVYGDPAYRDVARRMKQKLRELREEYEVPEEEGFSGGVKIKSFQGHEGAKTQR